MGVIVACIACVFSGGMAFRAYSRARPFRIETPERIARYRGTPWQWYLAVLRPSNYEPGAHSRVAALCCWMIALQLSLFAVVAALAVYFP